MARTTSRHGVRGIERSPKSDQGRLVLRWVGLVMEERRGGENLQCADVDEDCLSEVRLLVRGQGEGWEENVRR